MAATVAALAGRPTYPHLGGPRDFLLQERASYFGGRLRRQGRRGGGGSRMAAFMRSGFGLAPKKRSHRRAESGSATVAAGARRPRRSGRDGSTSGNQATQQSRA
mmetsp:Transcript_74809/g.216229  ORF Transcript_74809/g.216229 Transcript_74809/m.216229 type:complete len:104 (+) Transcript_74809:596-907(+)